MKSVSVLLGMLSIIFLAGCGGWSRPNTTEGEFSQDRFQCQQQSASMYPVIMQSAGAGYQTPSRTNCTTYGFQTNCTTTPGTYIPAPQSDVNAIARAGAFNSCLQAKGYVFKMGQ